MDAYSPIPAVILAIDPGATSGWALYSADRCIASGIAKTHEQRVMAIEIAQTEETRAKLRLIVVAEKWSPGGRWYTATMTGIGAAWGMWQAALEACEVPKVRVVRVYPQAWRSRVLTGRRGVKTEVWDLMAQRRARQEVGHDVGDDEADAICMGAWALRAEAVRAKVEKKGRAARKAAKRQT